MEKGYEISDQFESHEIETFLKLIWGEISPLTHVGEITHNELTPKEGTSKYCAIRFQGKVVALAGLKFVYDKTIELGSLAVHPNHRGKGLTKPLFEWRSKIIENLKKQDYQLITFSTLGSNIMNFIGSRMRDLGYSNTYPLNIGIGVVPISEDKMKKNLLDPSLGYKFKNKYYTSTLAILSTDRKYYYEDIEGFNISKLSEIFPNRTNQRIFVSSANIEFDIAPIRINIKLIKNSNESDFKILKSDLFNQVQVPILKEFEAVHKKIRKTLICTGFNINGDTLFAVYSNIEMAELEMILEYLMKIDDKDFYAEWVNLLIEVNSSLR